MSTEMSCASTVDKVMDSITNGYAPDRMLVRLLIKEHECRNNCEGACGMTRLAEIYQGYIDCLNTQNWDNLGRYVGQTVAYNGETVGLEAFRQARMQEFRDVPDLIFQVRMLVIDGNTLASRLSFDIRPSGRFLGLPVNGRRISFSENVFYEFEGGKIVRIWSVIDKAAVERQLSNP